MIGIVAAALLASVQVPAGQQATSPDPQTPPVTQLEDVTVTGRTLNELIGRFVDEVAEPNRGRGMGRWDRTVCVGVANLRAEVAHYLVDRISTVAEDLGLTPGGPGCTANLMIIATTDAGDLAKALVTNKLRAFYTGGSGTDRGLRALRDFQDTDRPIRWWQVTVPVDSATGGVATRTPGVCNPLYCGSALGSAFAYAPLTRIDGASRLRTQIVDNIFRTIVIVDADEVAGLTVQQIADYIAMVSLAQIDPTADASGYASILNVLDDPDSASTLTGWDLAYLDGLYGSQRNDVNRAAGRAEVEAAIHRAHANAREPRAGDED